MDEKDVGDLSDEEDSVAPSTIGKFVRYSYTQTGIEQTVIAHNKKLRPSGPNVHNSSISDKNCLF